MCKTGRPQLQKGSVPAAGDRSCETVPRAVRGKQRRNRRPGCKTRRRFMADSQLPNGGKPGRQQDQRQQHTGQPHRPWCASRVPERARYEMSVECKRAAGRLTIVERRAP